MLFRLRKYLSFSLLLTILLFIVPKEYIHDLYGHNDTHCLPHQGTFLEKPHRHCEILRYNTPLYTFQYKIFLLSVSFMQQAVLPYQQASCIIPFCTYFNLRAPPVLFL